MPSWLEFFAALVTFMASHVIPTRPKLRNSLRNLLGEKGFTACYSLLSTLLLGWVIVAAGRAPLVVLWPWAPWQNTVTLLAMALACVLTALAIGRPNPLSFGGANNASFAPRNAGIVGWVRHPLLVALLLWSLGHLLPNGTVAHVLLFALFAGFSALGMRAIDRRNQRVLGQEEWARLAKTKRGFSVSKSGVIRVGIGLLIYAALLWLHGPVIGVYPLI